MNTIQQVSEQTLKFEAVFTGAPLNQYFSYRDLEGLTGLKMTERNKQYMRSALRRLHKPYEVRRGEGIVLAGEKNAVRITAHQIIKIDNAVRKGEKTNKQVTAIAYHLLTDAEKKHINYFGALFGSIRSYSGGAKKIFNNQPLRLG